MTGYGGGAYGAGRYGIGGAPPTLDPHGSALDRHIGTQALAITVAGAVVPLTAAGQLVIRHGRSSVDQQPDAATATLVVDRAAFTELPTIGDELRVELGADVRWWLGLTDAAWTAARPRFVGELTDVTVSARSDITGPQLVTLAAVTRRARLGRTFVGGAPWPQELDGARAARILDDAAGLTVAAGDPGTVQVLARDVDRQPALGLLDDLARSTGGVLVETRDGAIRWHDAAHRSARPPAVTLPAADVIAPAATAQSLAGLVNSLTVHYGGSEQLQLAASASVDRYGPQAADVPTELATRADARLFGRLLLGRRARPRWSTPGLTVDLIRTVPDADTAGRLLGLEFGDLLAVTGFPSAGPFSTAQLWVEGWTETVTRTGWRLAVDVSDYQLTATPLRWRDVPPDLAWSDVPTDLAWIDARTAAALT